MTIAQIKAIFEQNACHEQGKRDEQYMRNLFPHYGVRAGDRDRLFAELFSKKACEKPIDWDFIQVCWDEPMREFQYIAVWYLHTRKNQLTKADILALRELAEQKPWWDTIDGMCGLFGDIVLRDESVK